MYIATLNVNMIQEKMVGVQEVINFKTIILKF